MQKKESRKLTDYHWKRRKELKEFAEASNENFSLEQMREQTIKLNEQLNKKKH